ncbi:MAG: Amino acid permease-associated region, partial [Marinimicrobia bacterium 46_43]
MFHKRELQMRGTFKCSSFFYTFSIFPDGWLHSFNVLLLTLNHFISFRTLSFLYLYNIVKCIITHNMEKTMTEHASSDLNKGLKLVHVFTIATGAMISSGLFILPGLAHSVAGPAVIWSYVMAGLLAGIGALSMAELSSAMPKAGSDYFFVMRGFGPAVGSVAGLLSWFSLTLKSSFAIVGMATFVRLIIDLNGLLIGAGLVILFVILNTLGVKQAARAQTWLVAGLLILLILYIIIGFPKINTSHLIPFARKGIAPVFSATGLVFVSYGGLLKVASMAEEVRDPGKNMPRGILLSLTTVMIIYALTITVTSGVLDPEKLDNSLIPISLGGEQLLGQTGFIAMSIGAILAFVSTANAGIMSASRYLLAMSRDKLLPKPLSRINNRFQTPHVAVMVTGLIMILSLLLELKILVEAASTVLMLTYILACLGVIILRESALHNYRPLYKSPFYPWLQIAGVIGLIYVLYEVGTDAYLISAALILVAFAYYWFFARKMVSKESALLHLVSRITNKQLVTGTLEDELKQIIRERDDISMDRFDHLVEKAPILDLKGTVSRDELFRLSAKKLSERLNIDEKKLTELLKKREEEGSTLLTPSLAVPHVIVEGSNRFELLIIRAKEGIQFSEDYPGVKTVFVIAGSRDQRSFHLRALAAIAQIVQKRDFEKRWYEATNEQGLRDIILLSTRDR